MKESAKEQSSAPIMQMCVAANARLLFDWSVLAKSILQNQGLPPHDKVSVHSSVSQ